ncbi:MAG TPA: hypothetical protein DEX20_01705 [Halieaceae bacterium]|nr:hypothetical protein [Halieaceae bacterium]
MTARSKREKQCADCQVACSVLFRRRSQSSTTWLFRCEACLTEFKLGSGSHYQYGGTWKARGRST